MKTFKVVVQTGEDTIERLSVEGDRYHIVNVADIAVLEISGELIDRESVIKEAQIVFSTPVDKLVYIKEVVDGDSSGDGSTDTATETIKQ
jgi:hypothetical protein